MPEPVPELSTNRLLTMTWLDGKQLLAAMGAPRRLTRTAVKQSFSEIWVYGEPSGSRIAVHLVRSRDDGTAAVQDISQLPSRR